jgi:DNA helicase-2/ATP-dependent DNA helicase PcrA
LGDRRVQAFRTRFIPDAILHLFETRTWPVAKSRYDRTGPGTMAAVDLKARMRGMWG